MTQNATYLRRHRAKRRALVHTILVSGGCVDCGERDPDVLDFDHVMGEKVSDVSRMVTGRAALSRLMDEIRKCHIRCANCHRRVTAKRLRAKGRGR